jgi:hypothetical protein
MTQMDMFDKELHPMQRAMVDRIVAALQNMGCQYSILLPGSMELLSNVPDEPEPERKSKRAPLKHPRGAVRNYYKPLLENVKPGDVVCIPFDRFDRNDLQSNIASYLTNEWGAKTYQTRIDDENKCVEVFRTGGI